MQVTLYRAREKPLCSTLRVMSQSTVAQTPCRARGRRFSSQLCRGTQERRPDMVATDPCAGVACYALVATKGTDLSRAVTRPA